MNIPARTELMAVLTEISRVAPYYRLGQVIALLTDRADHPYTASPIADIEDEELLPVAKEFLETLRNLPLESHETQIRAHAEPVATTSSGTR